MTKSKKIFLAFAGVFFLLMIIIGYDISKRTSFPGSRKLMIESLSPSDTVVNDSTKNAQEIENIEQEK